MQIANQQGIRGMATKSRHSGPLRRHVFEHVDPDVAMATLLEPSSETVTHSYMSDHFRRAQKQPLLPPNQVADIDSVMVPDTAQGCNALEQDTCSPGGRGRRECGPR